MQTHGLDSTGHWGHQVADGMEEAAVRTGFVHWGLF